jgi:4'-phosphopantetheinyl transferase
VTAAETLRPGTVEVWSVALDDQPPALLQLIQTLVSADEAERARKFYFERDWRRFLVGRGILRLLLGNYLGRGPRELVFTYGPHGKPVLASAGEPPVEFNLAHSDGLALLAFTRAAPLGVDLERIRDMPDWEQIAHTYFPPREIARVYAAAPDQRRQAFFRAWTRQEALLKAAGVGLGGGTVRRHPDDRDGLDGDGPGGVPDTGHEFSLHTLDVAPGYAAALAAVADARAVTMLTWNGATVPDTQRRRPIALPLLPTDATGSK